MKKNELLLMVDYNYWANDRVLRAAEKVSPEQWTAPADLSHNSLQGTLVHILGAEVTWRKRCQERVSPASLPAVEEFPTLAALKQRWKDEEQAMRTFAGSLDEDGGNRKINYVNTRGVAYSTPLWQILMHVVNHGTQFRSEAAVALTNYGHSPGDLDLIAYLREKKPPLVAEAG
jgi:uncharacterized damage-inducible protein DinB